MKRRNGSSRVQRQSGCIAETTLKSVGTSRFICIALSIVTGSAIDFGQAPQTFPQWIVILK